jgi:1-acyl-sn-glycerol-3-phosphate acyltransferase
MRRRNEAWLRLLVMTMTRVTNRIVAPGGGQSQRLHLARRLSIPTSVSVNGRDFSRRDSDRTFRILRAIAGLYTRTFHHTTVREPCRLPAKGPAILVCNHTSSIDPILLQARSPRLIRWMMAEEYFERQPMRWVFERVGVILVDRGNRDMASIRAAIRVLAAGYVLGVFPEGRIETSDEIIPFQTGIGLLAMKTRAPVYPAYLDGSQRGLEMIEAFYRRSEISIAFGEAVDLGDLADSKAAVLEATRRIQSAVESLKSHSKI